MGLVVQATRADRFDALFKAHHGAVRTYALQRAITADQASDVVAETFLVAWRRIDEVPQDPLPWLLVIVRKAVANQRRGESRRAALRERIAEAADLGGNDPADIVAEAEVMRTAFSQLSQLDREVLIDAACEGRGPARRRGGGGAVRAGTVAVRLHRARARLAAQVAALDGLPALLATVAMAAALLATPTGRGGLSWAAELVGVGDVGGPPSKADRGPLRPTAGPLVVDNGRAPDNSRYEWVAHRGGLPELSLEGGRHVAGGTGLCLAFDWPDHPHRRTREGCSQRPERYPPVPAQIAGPIQSFGFEPAQRPAETSAPDIVLSGSAEIRVARLEITYARKGVKRRLPTDLAPVNQSLLRRLGLPQGRPRPFAVFTAFVPARAASDAIAERFTRGAVLVDRNLRSGSPSFDRCARAAGPPRTGPFTLNAFDARGRIIDTRRTILGRSLPLRCARFLGGWRRP